MSLFQILGRKNAFEVLIGKFNDVKFISILNILGLIIKINLERNPFPPKKCCFFFCLIILFFY